MRAIWITSSAGPAGLEVRESPDPVPGPGQVRVRVRAAGLCFAEVMAAQGLYPDAPKPPCVMGYEAAGVIDKVGDGVADERRGSRVIALTSYGGHSDVVCVPAGQALAIPPGKDFDGGRRDPGELPDRLPHPVPRRLRSAPASGCSCTWPRAASARRRSSCAARSTGVETFGTASAAKHAALREEGCTHPIDYRTADYAREVRRLTNGEGVDVVLDPLGGADSRKGLKLLRPVRPAGRLRVRQPGQRPAPPSGARAVPGRVHAAAHPAAADEPQQGASAVSTSAASGTGSTCSPRNWPRSSRSGRRARITPRIDATYPFAQAADAHRRILSRQNTGKIVLTP